MLTPDGVVLAWDIDGTLLTTGRAGIGAWEDAVLAVAGRPMDFAALPTAGLTDIEIGRQLLSTAGASADPATLSRLVAHYEHRLPVRLPERQGQVLPGVREFLAWNAAGPGVPCLLLTGNTRRGADAKLRHYGLWGFFGGRGAFASLEAADRVSVARRAVAVAADLVGPAFRPDRMVVIGDTPHDVACGKAIGARTLAVATGGYAIEALEAAGPWRTLATLPTPEELLQSVV